jgi:hypothetical protein
LISKKKMGEGGGLADWQWIGEHFLGWDGGGGLDVRAAL